MAEASSSGRPWDESMELDEAMENRDEEAVETSANPGEANLGLGCGAKSVSILQKE